jgi:hypothetical protein
LATSASAGKQRAAFSAAALLAATVLLGGCAATGGANDDTFGRYLVSPDKFAFYTCPQLADKAKETAARAAELRALMARAEAGAGGDFVSSVAYRPDYLQVHGEMNELRKTAAEKNCGALPDAPQARPLR